MTTLCARPIVEYVPVAGTHAFTGGWWKDDDHPFQLMMAREGFRAIRRPDGTAYRWSTALDGLLGRNDDWEAFADSLGDFLEVYIVRWRLKVARELVAGDPRFTHSRHVDGGWRPRIHLICHSHGGQGAIILAARGFPVDSLTLVGTPRRKDVPAEQAVAKILARGGMVQQIYDLRRDWIACLGQFGDDDIDRERAFRIPGVQLHPMRGIKHSDVLNKADFLHYWQTNHWLELIRHAGTTHVSPPTSAA